MSVDALDSASTKVAWAKKHLSALNEDVLDFLKTKSHATRIEYDADSGWHTLSTEVIKQLHSDWPLICGDAIQNLRNALDHVAWGFALDRGRGKVPSKPQQIDFPITSCPKYFRSATVKNWITADQLAFIEKRQPYNGGDYTRDPLWVLRELSNRDKHRVLHTAHTFVRRDGEISFKFNWDEASLGRLLEQDISVERESFLVDGTQFGRIRFERPNPDGYVSMDGKAPVLIAFGDSKWTVDLADIGVIGAIVERIIEDAEPLFVRS